MSPTLQHLDTITFSNKPNTNLACNLSTDGRISLITESGILIYTLTNYFDNVFTDVALEKRIILIPDFSLSTELGIEFEHFYNEMPKDDLFEKVLRLDQVTKLEHSTPVDVKPIAAKWSPRGLQGKSHCVLSALSNCFGLSIFIKFFDEAGVEDYCCVTNVTKIIVKHQALKWVDITNTSVDIQLVEWKKRASSTCPTAFEWSHLVETSEETFAILFVGHFDGSITSWKFTRRDEYNNSQSGLSYIGTFSTTFDNICAMHWEQTVQHGGALTYGDINGKLSVTNVKALVEEKVLYENNVILENKNHQKRVDYITTVIHNGYTYLIAVLGEYLSVVAITDDGSVINQVYFYMGDFSITGMGHFKDNMLLVLTSGRLNKLTIDVKGTCIDIKEEIVPIKFDSTKLKSYGLIISHNRIMFGILAYPCRLKDISRVQTPSTFIIYHDASLSPFEIIMSNKDKSLKSYWDCFEVLRLLSYKDKRFPWQGIDKNLDYDKLTLTQLKSLRWIAKLSENVYRFVPYITEYNIKPYIILHFLVTIRLVINRMQKLLTTLATGGKLSTFQMNSLEVGNMFLKEMVLMKILEKANAGEVFIDNITDVMEKANILEYPQMPPCFWCSERITGPTCIPPHADSRCSISMMQIPLMPGFKCPFCKCVAHQEILKEMDLVTCPYCDIPMDHLNYRETTKNLNIDSLVEEPDEKLNSDQIAVIESLDETDSYMALSESDDDEELLEKKTNVLRSKFFEMMKSNNIKFPEKNDVNKLCLESAQNQSAKNNDNDDSDYSFNEESDEEHKRTVSN